MFYIGLDLGTSGLKGLLVDDAGRIERQAYCGYPVLYLQDGWSEQDPAVWVCAAERVLGELSRGYEERIAGVSVAGQMHGLVLLDAQDRVIRPAILWNDGRAQEQSERLNREIGAELLTKYTANIAFAGFTAPKILWVKENEPENFRRIAKLMLPKDYLTYVLTGVFSTEYSDASGMLLLDVKNRRWSREMCGMCSVEDIWLPRLHESWEVTGRVLPRFRLPGAVVVAGAGDNAAAAVGTGTVGEGACNISLGTSGTVFIANDTFSADCGNALHNFCHATGKWHLMGCILSAASCNRWWLEEILRIADYNSLPQDVPLGKNDVFFLPYLMGERSPHNDAKARGAFLGLRADTSREDMGLAVLEGVAFALRDCVEAARRSGTGIERATVCGGGAKSKLWLAILANVLNCELVLPETEQGPAYGAAILAMVGSGRYPDVETAAKALFRAREKFYPDRVTVENYQSRYSRFVRFYPALKGMF